MRKERLLGEFAPHTEEEWKEAAVQLLKGRSFEKTLVTPTYEGIDLQPLYTREKMRPLGHLDDLPGAGSQVRGSRLEGYLEAGWLVSQELSAPTPELLNALALGELACGQNELNLWLDRSSRAGMDPSPEDQSVGMCGVSLSTVGDLKTLLHGIHPEMISLYFQSGSAAPALYGLLAAWLRQSGLSGTDLRGCLGLDPFGWLVETGSQRGSAAEQFDLAAELVADAAQRMPQLQILDIQGHPYHNAGGHSVQEMAAVLAAGVTCLKELARRGVDPATTASRMRLSVSVGGHYFMEVAKLRALRLLWSRVLEAFGVPDGQRTLHLHARTGLWNKTLFDPYVNMLRTTTEAFSAVVGGCDSLHVSPFDEVIRESDTFARRIARNTHAILAEECGLKQVVDPAGGSWAVETLTDDLAGAAWKAFQDLEAEGGLLASLKAGALQGRIEAVREERLKNIQRRKDVIVGTNAYPNATEKLLARPAPGAGEFCRDRAATVAAWKAGRDAAGVEAALTGLAAAGPGRVEALVRAAEAGATLGELQAALSTGESVLPVRPLHRMRAAGEFEQLRLAARKLAGTGRPARVHQLNMGPSRRYRIRADWTSSFFQVGGLEVLNADDFETVEQALGALRASGARVAVITSDDETYVGTVEPLAAAVKEADPDVRVLVAGAPGESEAAWRAAGVDDFVHVRVNNYSFNRALLESLGAEI